MSIHSSASRAQSGLSARLLGQVSAIALLTVASPAALHAQTAINLNALAGLVPVTVLNNSAAGKAALSANLAITNAIQHGTDSQPLLLSFSQQQEKALKDAFITSGNAYELADGLGTKLGAAYQSRTSYTSTNDGTTSSFTSISPAVANLINYTYTITGSDSNSGKYFFSNLTTNGTTPVSATAAAILAATGGTTDVFGKAYGLPAGSPGADPYGDSRPFQTEPNYLPYTGADYFGVPSSNTAYLSGPTQNLIASPSFPSGHTTYGYTESTLLALLVPQRFQQMITRAAEYGNDRIVLGAHYTMDVIAGRTLAYYDISQMLANNPAYVGQTEGGVTITNYQTALGEAGTSLTSALQGACGNTIAVCAAEDTGEFSNSAANKAFYESTQTYGLPVVYQTTAHEIENVATLAPNAGYLLETRFPYLTLQQADDVLTSTEGPGGGFLDNGSSFGVYSRLDLYDAANGYGSFASNVSITMNAALGGYNAVDIWSNNIGGAGGFTLNGTGQLTFAGADTYTGPTAVDGGTLIIDGSVVSPVTVNAGGTLAGSGTIRGGATVNSGGTISPGDDPGTLTANASVRLAAGSISDFDVDGTGTGSGAGNYSRIVVDGGNFTAGGTLVPLLRGISGPATNTYTPPLGTQFGIVSATGGVTGGYSGLVQPVGLATGTRFDTIYGPNTITLAVTPASYAHLGSSGVAGETPVESAIGAALDAGRPAAGTNADGSLYGPLYGTAPLALTESLQEFSPEAYGADLLAARDGAEQVDTTVDDQLDARMAGGASGGQTALLPNGSTVWVSGIGQFLNITGDNSTGYTGSLGGFAAGIDHELQPGARAGAAIAYLNQTVNVGDGSSATGDTIEGVIYGGARQGILFENLQAGILGLEGTAKRYQTGYGSETQGNFNGLGGGASLRAGVIVNEAGFEVQPSLALDGLGINRDSATESNSTGAGLDVTSGSVSSLQSLASVKVARSMALGGMAFTPSVNIGWAHQFLDTTTVTSAQFAATGAGFGVNTPSVGRDAAVAGVRAELDATQRMKVFLAYDGAFASNSTINSVTGGVQYSW